MRPRVKRNFNFARCSLEGGLAVPWCRTGSPLRRAPLVLKSSGLRAEDRFVFPARAGRDGAGTAILRRGRRRPQGLLADSPVPPTPSLQVGPDPVLCPMAGDRLVLAGSGREGRDRDRNLSTWPDSATGPSRGFSDSTRSQAPTRVRLALDAGGPPSVKHAGSPYV